MVTVSHGDVIRAALLFALGMPLDFYSRIEIAFASLSTIRLDGCGDPRGHAQRVAAAALRLARAASAAATPLSQAPWAVEKKFGEAGFAGKEQAVVDRGGEHCAVVGMAGEGVGVGTARPRVVLPGGRGERRQLLADVVAKEPGELAGGEGKHRPLPFPLELRREAPAEETIDRRAVERSHLIGHRFPRAGRADEVSIVLDPGKQAVQGNEELVVDPERQACRRHELVGERRVEADDLAGDDRGRHGNDDAPRGDGAARRFEPDRPAAMVDPSHRGLPRHRQPFGERFEEPAIALAQPPVGPAVLVADIVLDRDPVELGAVPPGARRVEQLVPSSARRDQARERAVRRFHGGLSARPVLRLAGGDPIRLGL